MIKKTVYELAEGYLDGAVKSRIEPIIEKKNRSGIDYYENIHKVMAYMEKKKTKTKRRKTKMSGLKDFRITDGVLERYRGKDANVIVPEGVTSIGESAFSWCSSLQSITIPEGVTSNCCGI